MNSLETPNEKRGTVLRRQVMIWLVACAMVPLAVMALQGYHCARQAVLSLETTHLRSVLEGRKTRIMDWLEERKRNVKAISAHPCACQGCAGPSQSSGEARNEDYCQLLAHVRSSNPSFKSLTAYDASWRRLATSGDESRDDSELIPGVFRSRLEQSSEVVVEPAHLHDPGRIGIHLGARTVGNKDTPGGYVVAVILLSETLYPILEDNRGLRGTTKTYIVSPDGHFLSGPRPHIEMLSQGTEFPDGFLDGRMKEASSYRDCCGNRTLGMSSPMPDLGWVLVTEVDQSEAFAWLSVLRRRAVVTAGVVLVTLLFLSLAGARRVARPFRELQAVASRIAAGNHGQRVPVLGSAEADEVGETLNCMLDELAVHTERLVNAGALAAVGKLSSSIVHEMRNPLSSIKLNLAAMRDVFPGGSDDRELADIALREATRVEGMLNDLLAYGKPLELSVQPTSLARLLQRVVDHAKIVCREREVEISLSWNGHERCVWPMDEEQMLRALCNLTDNASCFAPEHSVVVLSVTTPANDARALEMAVSDWGPGVSREHLEHVFEPFFTTRDRGTGLGLANVKKILECHGGTVRVANRPEGGAIFTVRLPGGSGMGATNDHE